MEEGKRSDGNRQHPIVTAQSVHTSLDSFIFAVLLVMAFCNRGLICNTWVELLTRTVFWGWGCFLPNTLPAYVLPRAASLSHRSRDRWVAAFTCTLYLFGERCAAWIPVGTIYDAKSEREPPDCEKGGH